MTTRKRKEQPTEISARAPSGLVMRAPFSAGMLPLGSPVWFVQDKFGHNVCQILPGTDGKTAVEMSSLLNIAAGFPDHA